MADMSPPAVVARLREVSRLRNARLAHLEPVDMSPEAVRSRLWAVAQLSALCRRLGTTRKRSDEPSSPQRSQ